MEEDVPGSSAEERLGSPPNHTTEPPQHHHHPPDHQQQQSSSSSIQLHPDRRPKTPGGTNERDLSPFHRLPRTVIENILYIVDANTFASLALLNRKWRRISDSSSLYAHQLSRCPSYALTQKATSASPGAAHTNDLARLKRDFLAEIRRNAFEVFLRPRTTLIKLISTSMSSSTAFPQGEAFRFSFSPNSLLILCLSSSRIVVLDVTSDPAVVRHELKTWRRPLHATILDDGSILAIASSSHQVNIYSLSNDEARHIQDLKLTDVPQALALSPTGGVLAIAYSDRIEVQAIGETALVTERRAVRCAGVNSMSFSPDGVMLLGSCEDAQHAGLVTISVPFFTEPDAESSPRDAQIRMWTTQILFPDIIQGYSHACLLPLHTEGDGNWILGFDKEVAAFRAVGAGNINSGTVYFTSPIAENGLEESAPNMPPTVDCTGELAALGFHESGIWIYGIPDRLDIAPVSTQSAASEIVTGEPSDSEATTFTDPPQDNLTRLQESITRPKMIISGHKLSDMSGVTAIRWVGDSNLMVGHRRLVAVAPGGVRPPTIGDEDVPVDGGRVLLLDFKRSTNNGSLTEMSIEIGEAQPKMLHEPNSSLDTEVELERRRTRLHRRNDNLRMRGARESYPAATSIAQTHSFQRRRNSSVLSTSSNGLGEDETLQGLDMPYDNTQPRSRDTLRRAATAAAASRGRYNPRYRDESRRIYDSRAVPPIFQIPHESDADNWVPPPPPYSREPDAPLPEHLRRTLLPSRTEPVQRVSLSHKKEFERRNTRPDAQHLPAEIELCQSFTTKCRCLSCATSFSPSTSRSTGYLYIQTSPYRRCILPRNANLPSSIRTDAGSPITGTFGNGKPDRTFDGTANRRRVAKSAACGTAYGWQFTILPPPLKIRGYGPDIIEPQTDVHSRKTYDKHKQYRT
ncbi:F-box domain protein [Aspergillus terreus]|uniref:F-box domain protein n=1 Tax=Aspergillus terreus TaxID=33178 RepID=A0A5M3ZBQ6_ASPTE|nr:hypothetical protein ATETN484_0014005800 [Aspergillus terreus]GFF20724.1 F-box domain protein [Aspergillus terreus]